MIYAFTDSEIMALCYASGLEVGRISPVYDLCEDVDGLHRLEEKMAGLTEMGLVSTLSKDYETTPQGHLLSLALFQPQSVAEFTRKNTPECPYTALRYGKLWYVHYYEPDRKLHLVWSVFSRDLLVRWLQGNLLFDYEPTEPEADVALNTSLSYDEFSVFLMTQFACMRREMTSREPVQNRFTDEEIKDPDALSYFRATLTSLGTKSYAGMIQYLYQDENEAAYREAVNGLCDKGLLLRARDGSYAYSSAAVAHLDNARLFDTLRVVVRRADSSSCSLLISLRTNGVVVMSDDGQAVNLVSAAEVPWGLYLE